MDASFTQPLQREKSALQSTHVCLVSRKLFFTSENSQFRNCFDFCTAYFRSLLASKSAVQSPKHCLSWVFYLITTSYGLLFSRSSICSATWPPTTVTPSGRSGCASRSSGRRRYTVRTKPGNGGNRITSGLTIKPGICPSSGQ